MFASRRCLIPTDGFHEWRREGGAKQPWLIGMEDREPFATLTAATNEIAAPIHHRMPVILAPTAFGSWLAGAKIALEPYPPEAMTA